MLNPNNSNYKIDSLITSDATGSHESHTSTAHPSVALGWDSTFSFKQNLLWLTHSLLDNKSEFTSFFTTHPCTAKRVLCVCGDSLSVCLNRWRNWLRKVIYLWSHSRASSHYEPCSLQDWEPDDCASHQNMRCGRKKKNIHAWCCRGANAWKNVATSGWGRERMSTIQCCAWATPPRSGN